MGNPVYGETTDSTDTDKTKGTKSGGSGSSWSGSTSSGGDSAKEKKGYMQGYLQVIETLYGKRAFSKAQAKIAAQAYALRFDPTTFADMLRRHDPMYVRSTAYRDRVTEAKDLYQSFRPGRPIPHGFLKNYARSDMSVARLQDKMEKSGWFKREFAGWTEAQKAGSPAGNSPQTYLAYRNLWNNTLSRYDGGRTASPLEHKMMFGSGMTGDEVANNLVEMFGGKESLKWATGMDVDRDAAIKGALTTKYGLGGLGAVRGARQTQSGFLGSENRKFDIGVDDLTGNLASSRI